MVRNLEQGKSGPGGAFWKVRSHTVTSEDVDNEILAQLNEASLFGETSFVVTPRASATKAEARVAKEERRERDRLVKERSQPILDAADAHNSAHQTEDEAKRLVRQMRQHEKTARENVFLGDPETASVRVTQALTEATRMEEIAKSNIRATNTALPSRLAQVHV